MLDGRPLPPLTLAGLVALRHLLGQSAVPILDRVVRPARHQFRDFGPAVPVVSMALQ